MKRAKFGKTGLPVITVHWEDSTTYMGWSSIKRPWSVQTIFTTGYLISEDKRTITVGASVDPDGDTTDAITIPRGCIKSVRKHGL